MRNEEGGCKPLFQGIMNCLRNECDPCRFCQHYSEYEDRDTGWTDEGCNAPEEFPIFDGGEKPCRYFKPILASDGLFEQLAEEDEERYYLERGKEFEEEFW